MRAIVTGASGLLGRAVYKAFREAGHEVTGLAKSRAKNGLRQFDLTDKDKLDALIQELKPDAERRPDVAEKNREATFELNVNVPAHIASLSKAYNILFIQISTDYVFDGKNPPYDVNDKPNPLNFYVIMNNAGNHFTSGETKYQGELAVQNANRQA
ncbi:17800_t:CDS:2, partial [Cetraspora pellucida]